MQGQSRQLGAAAVRHQLGKLDDVLSKGDVERLDKILPLFENDDEAPVASLAACLARLNAGSDVQQRLADFRSLRHRLKNAAAEAGTGLELCVDSKKRSKPEDRLCWFMLPPDPAADHVADWTQRATVAIDDVTGIYSRAALSGGLAVRFVAACGNDEETRCLAEDLLSRLREHVDAAAPYDYSIWEPERILTGETSLPDLLSALDEQADFALLMSPQWAALDCRDQDTLRRREKGSGKPVIHVALKGLDRATESFESRAGEYEKEQFVLNLAHEIKDRLQEHQSRAEQEQGAQRLADAADAPSDPLVDARAQETSLDAALALPRRGRQIPAIHALREWVEDDNAPPYFVLFGEYGIGKTTTLKQFAQSLLARRRKGEDMPLPIFINLRAHSDTIRKGSVPSLEILLQEILEQAWETPGKLPFMAEDILRLVREEGAVMIFDGLDEKLVHLDEDQGRAFLRTLWQALPPAYFRAADAGATGPRPAGRLVFSCRSHYFKTLSDQNATFRSEDRDGIRPAYYRVWYLLPFDDDQIRDYLSQALKGDSRQVEAALDLFTSVHNLQELAPRPYLLSLMAAQIGELEHRRARGEVVRGVTLYKSLVEEWLTRDNSKHKLRSEDKLYLMEDIAADMWREGAGEWPWRRVLDWLTQRLDERAVWHARYFRPGVPLELLEEDFRTATFVLRPDDSQDRFRFAHTSLQEYFLARYLHRALLEARHQKWEMGVPSPETLDFLGQLIVTSPETRDEVLRSMEDILAHAPGRGTDIVFRYWLQAVGCDLPRPVPQQVNLRGLDLSGLTIRGSSDQPLNLFAADLCGANLAATRFEDVDLSRADLSGVQGEGAEFHRVTARGINLAEADLTASVWRRSDINGLRGAATASWYDAQLIACDLEPNDLPGDFGLAGTLSEPRDPTRSIPLLQAFPAGPAGEITTVLGHTDGVRVCLVTPDGRHLVSASDDCTLKVWDFNSGRCLRTLEGHVRGLNDCAVSPDGRYVVSASADWTLKVWDFKSGSCLHTLAEHDDEVSACAITPDSRYVISASSDGTIKLWDISTGDYHRTLRTVEDAADFIYTCAISPDGRHLILGIGESTIEIRDLVAGAVLRTLEGHTAGVTTLAMTGDGRYLISGSEDNTIKVWDFDSGKCLRTLEGHETFVQCCVITADGRQVVSASEDNTLKVWDFNSGKCLRTLEGHRDLVLHCVITPDGRHLVSGSNDNTLKVWSVESGACVRTLEGSAQLFHFCCTITPDGRHLVSESHDNALRIWGLDSGICLGVLEGHTDLVKTCAITPDGRYLVSGSHDRTLRIWALESGRCLHVLEGHGREILCCAITPDGRFLVSGSMDNTLKVWDVNSAACLFTLEGHENWVHSCAITDDGRYLVSGSGDNTLKVWNLDSRKCLRTLKGPMSGLVNCVRACTITPDGRFLVSGADDGELRVWALESGKYLYALEGHEGGISRCAITPDGRYLVSGGGDNTLKVWDLESRKCLHTLQGHAGGVASCAIAPDGHYLVSGSRDGTLKIWNADLGTSRIIEGMTLIDGPNKETAALDYRNNRVLSASPEAWSFLGWRYLDPEAGRLRILPAEHAGPLPIK